MSNAVRYSKHSLVTLSTKDNTAPLKDQRLDENDLLRLHKQLVLKQASSKEVVSPSQPKTVRDWLKHAAKQLPSQVSTERPGLTIPFQGNFTKKTTKNSQNSKPDSAKGSKNNSKLSSNSKQNGKLLIDRILSQRSSSKQAAFKCQPSGSKKSLKPTVPDSKPVTNAYDSLRKFASHAIKEGRSDSKKGLETAKLVGEMRDNVQKFKKFTYNLLETNNKYLKKIGKKNNLFDMRKMTEKYKQDGCISSTDFRFGNSLMHDDRESAEFLSSNLKGIYESADKENFKKMNPSAAFYNIFKAKMSLDDMAASIDSAEPAPDSGEVNPELVSAMNNFKLRLRDAIHSSESRLNKSVRRAFSKG